MEYLKKFRPAIEKRNIVVPSSSLEEEKSRGINMSANAEEEIFADFDGEKDKVKEWWLQPEVEEAVEEHEEVEGAAEGEREEVKGAVEGEQKEEEGGEKREEASKDKDDLINSLREENEEDDLCTVLKEAMEEMGDVGAEGLLEIGRAALRGMTEGRK